MSKDSAAIRDQLGTNPETIFLLNADFFEELGVEEQSTRVSTKTLGNAWIVGTTTNAIVGTNTGTQGGGQQVVGGSGRVTTLQRVVNPNNTFREHFRDDTFKDGSGGNTASWDVTNYRLAMSSVDDQGQVYNTVATFGEIFLNSQVVLRATVNCTETKFNPNDVIKYFLSANGGSDWEEFTLGVEKSFGTTGQDLRLKILFFGNGGLQTFVEDLSVEYGL